MLYSKLIHPDILRILAQAGHHATILISDGNYPASSKRGPRSEVVSLNLMPGVVTCNQ
ncbi:MAG: RbsD/FucU domain-containing protein, partial [Pirellula sp.]